MVTPEQVPCDVDLDGLGDVGGRPVTRARWSADGGIYYVYSDLLPPM